MGNREYTFINRTKEGDDSLECLNGIRVLSMCWVILGHTYVVAEFVYLRNPMKITDVSTKKKVSTFVTCTQLLQSS